MPATKGSRCQHIWDGIHRAPGARCIWPQCRDSSTEACDLPDYRHQETHPLHGLFEPASAPYPDAAMVSIAISLKRIADIQAAGLVELPLKHGGAAHIRPSQVASVSVHGQHLSMAFVQMIGDAGETGFTVTLSVGEVMERLRP